MTDPLGALAPALVHRAWSRCSVPALIGGAIDAACGGAGAPTLRPVLGAGIDLALCANARAGVVAVPWAIAWATPLGAWLDAVCEALALRIEMSTDPGGEVVATLTDVAPAESPLNAAGPLLMQAGVASVPGLRTMRLGRVSTTTSAPARSAVLDVADCGTPRVVGDSLAVGGVCDTNLADLDWLADRERRGAQRDAAAQLRVEAITAQPGLVPGRTIAFASSEGAGDLSTLFGAPLWQAGDVTHLYLGGAYANRTEIEKPCAWFPPRRSLLPALRVLCALIGTGEEPDGSPVYPDPLGRVAVRVPAGAPGAVFALARTGFDGGCAPRRAGLPTGQAICAGCACTARCAPRLRGLCIAMIAH